MKKKVLFICTHNSARIQVAEALLNNLYGDRYYVCPEIAVKYSFGSKN